MRLLLDLGNTRLKWAMHASSGWLAQGAVAWGEDVAATLRSNWSGLPKPASVCGASVVAPEREALVEHCVHEQLALAIRWLRTPSSACGVHNAYPEPRRLGVDRFLAMIAAHADGLGDCVLASVGTALTLDALAADGRHLGGLIAPGPQLMRQALLGATAQVRPERTGEIVELADNTADAVTSGCWQAAVALIERFVGQAGKQLGSTPHLCLGGGDAALLASLLSPPVRRFDDAVLRGLAIWAQSDVEQAAHLE